MKEEVKEFYRNQNEIIIAYLNADYLHSIKHTYGNITSEDLEKSRVSRKVKTKIAREARTIISTLLQTTSTSLTPTRAVVAWQWIVRDCRWRTPGTLQRWDELPNNRHHSWGLLRERVFVFCQMLCILQLPLPLSHRLHPRLPPGFAIGVHHLRRRLYSRQK